jgi:DNA-binding response OmpR family regulator
VIVAEDDYTLRGLIASVLRSEGYETVEARDGVELLARIEEALVSRGERADSFLIVTDVCMPGVSGLDVLAILRCAHATTPVILITAFGDRETYAEARELGASAVFDKPFDVDRLRAAVVDTAPPR